MPLQEILARYAADLHKVEEHLSANILSEVALIPEVSDHLIRSGGKRFRPLLLLLTADLCGYMGDRRYLMAVIVEFIHTASLLHDDVVDHADSRRGKPSANHVWGNSASVLVGDYLYSKAFRLMGDDGELSINKLIATVSNTMAEGEVFQLVKSGDFEITEEEYFSLIEKKTAILIAASCALGGLLAKVSEEKVSALMRFGMRVGTAFQMTDDTLDYMADEKDFGKAIGTDLREGKITLPLIHALKRCTPEERVRIRAAVKKEDITPAEVGGIIAIIQKYDGIDYALNRAKTLIGEAKAALDCFDDGDAKLALTNLAQFVIDRNL